MNDDTDFDMSLRAVIAELNAEASAIDRRRMQLLHAIASIRALDDAATYTPERVATPPVACSNERAAVEFMERQRWGDTPACPRCGDTDVYQMKGAAGERNARWLWRCRGCTRQFTVRVGTIMEDSAIPMRHWCYAFWAACASEMGVSAKQIQRMTGVSYKSALFVMHRIRWAVCP